MKLTGRLLPFVAALSLLFLFQSDQAEANYEYRCGAHRTAKCHAEPRADEGCAATWTACYGRCGPGCGWSALGNKYTSSCQNHDWCVRDYLCKGYSGWQAHSWCAGGLPNAVGSFVQSHWNYGFQWAKDTWSGLWTKVKSCCN